MKATYDGTLLSAEGFGDHTWQTRFSIRHEAAIQTARPMRGTHAVHHSRGLRSCVIELLLVPPPEADMHESYAALALYYETLPTQGDLTIESGGNQMTWPDACLMPFSPPPRRGISNEYPLAFLAAANAGLVRLMLDELGAVLEDEAGVPLEY